MVPASLATVTGAACTVPAAPRPAAPRPASGSITALVPDASSSAPGRMMMAALVDSTVLSAVCGVLPACPSRMAPPCGTSPKARPSRSVPTTGRAAASSVLPAPSQIDSPRT